MTALVPILPLIALVVRLIIAQAIVGAAMRQSQLSRNSHFCGGE